MRDVLKTSQLISDKKDKVIWALNKHTNSISCRPPPGVYGTLQLSKDIQGVQASFGPDPHCLKITQKVSFEFRFSKPPQIDYA